MGRLLVLALAALGLSGCAVTADAGQAAVSEEFQVSQGQVDSEVREVLAAVGGPAAQPPENLALATVQRLVQDRLIETQAAQLGLEATQAEVDRAVAELSASSGGDEALAQSGLAQGIPESGIASAVRTNLLLAKIGPALAKDADQSAQEGATRKALTELSDSLDVRVAPRYGTWSDEALAIQPGSSVARPAPPEPGVG